MESMYYSFLIRLWASENNANSTWHISLESSETGEKFIFAHLDDLMNFFENLTRAPAELRRDITNEQAQ